jgi:proteic killer suppression protein
VIQTFADGHTQMLYTTGKSRRFPPDVPPGNRLHALRGDRKGQHAIAVNDQWRICFRFVDGDAYDVEMTDYH